MTEVMGPRIELKNELFEVPGAERTGPKLQRIMAMNAQERAIRGSIKNLHSLDPDFSRTFGNDIKDPFAVDKTSWKLGSTYDKPRIWTYVYQAPPSMKTTGSGWIREIVIMEGFNAPELLPSDDVKLDTGKAVTSKTRGKAVTSKTRRPDFKLLQMEISDEELKLLRESGFKAHFIHDPEYFSTTARNPTTGKPIKRADVFDNVRTIPKSVKGKITRLFVRVIDYNSIKTIAGSFSGHFLKTRNTLIAGLKHSIEIFDLDLAPKAVIGFMMRDIMHLKTKPSRFGDPKIVQDAPGSGKTKVHLGVTEAGGRTYSIAGEVELDGDKVRWAKTPKIWNVPDGWMRNGFRVLDDFKRIRDSIARLFPEEILRAARRR